MIDHERVRQRFVTAYGRQPRLFTAPGRVNLIGEHTDYNDGFVLPMAIDRGTVVAAAPREDTTVRARSTNLDAEATFALDAPGPPRRGVWIDYLEGVAQALRARGVALRGADLLLESDVPSGAGLSSSAALEMAVGLALVSCSGATLGGVDLALAGQAAEHQYVGTQCGIMDQYISALGRADHALLIDCRSLVPTPVPLDLGDHVIVICDSQVKHELASSAYNTRRAECEAGVRALRAALPEIRALRDVSPEQLAQHERLLEDPVRKRVRHVVTENARTLAAAEALRAGRLDEMGRLMAASHRSLRDDYEVSCEELDALVDMALAVPGVAGARMTGGGFGGCTVNLVATSAVDALGRALTEGYTRRYGRAPALFASRACAGAHEIGAETVQ